MSIMPIKRIDSVNSAKRLLDSINSVNRVNSADCLNSVSSRDKVAR